MVDRSDWKLNPVIFQKIIVIWSSGSGPICITANCTVPSLFQLAARSLCHNNKCIPAGLVTGARLCQLPLEPNRTGSLTCPNATGTNYSGGTSLEDTNMTPTIYTDVHCLSSAYQRPADNAQSSSSETIPTTSRIAYLRERYREQELVVCCFYKPVDTHCIQTATTQ